MSIAEQVVRRHVDLADWVYDILQNDRQEHRFWVTKGLRSGGTWGLAHWHYIMCQINWRSKMSWCVAPTFQQIADTVIPTFTEVLSDSFGLIESIDFDVVRSAHPHIRLKKYEQTIWLRSGNRPEKMVGPTISHCSMTEPGLQSRLSYEKSSNRISCPNAVRRQYLLEGSPEGLEGFFAEEANFPPGTDWSNNKTRVVLWSHDNPRLPSTWVEQAHRTYQHDEQKLKSYVYGQFVAFTRGTAYWEFRHSRNVTLDLQASAQLPITITWDWNHTPLAWVALQVQPTWSRAGTKFDRYTVLGESSGKSNGIMDACAEFVAQFDPVLYRDTPIDIDGGADGFHKSHLATSCAFDQVVQALSRYYRNIRVVAARSAPRIKDRLQRHNALLAYRYLVLAAWCRNTIQSHEQTNLKDGKLDQIDKGKDDKVSHYGDALGYALFRLTKNTDLINPNAKQIFGFN